MIIYLAPHIDVRDGAGMILVSKSPTASFSAEASVNFPPMGQTENID